MGVRGRRGKCRQVSPRRDVSRSRRKEVEGGEGRVGKDRRGGHFEVDQGIYTKTSRELPFGENILRDAGIVGV